MIKYLLAIVIMSAGVNLVSGFCDTVWAYEIAKLQPESEECKEVKSKSEKIKLHDSSSLYLNTLSNLFVFANVVLTPGTSYSLKPYCNLVRQPQTPPPDYSGL